MNRRITWSIFIVTALMTAAACSNNKQEAVPASDMTTAANQAKETTPDMQALLNPSKATEQAPASFKVKFKTTKGDFTVEVNRSWSPLGADRFYNLAKIGYFSDVAFFRVVPNFVAQFGIHGDPAVSAKWRAANIGDDTPGKASNGKGTLTYAMAGPGTRTTQLFVNFRDNSRLDSMGFTPFGKITSGMDAVEAIYSGYGDGAPYGMGPDQGRIQMEGNSYLKKDFPNLDYIISATIE